MPPISARQIFVGASRDGWPHALQEPWHGASDMPSCREKQETHRLAERKQQQMAKLENAFGLSDVVEGEAFNRELQEERKQKVLSQSHLFSQSCLPSS